MTGGSLEGDELGSTRLRFRPGAIGAGTFEFDVADVAPSAGAVTLVAQALLPVLAVAPGPSSLVLRGGTHVAWSPPVDYLAGVLAPALRRLGVGLSGELVEWGWYPRGGGEARLEITPLSRSPQATESLATVDWGRRGAPRSLRLVSVAGGLPEDIAERQASAARQALEESLDEGLDGAGAPEVHLEVRRVESRGRGTLLYLEASYEPSDIPPAGFTALGRKGRPAESVGRAAVDDFMRHHRAGAAVDVHLADQLVPFLALASGTSRYTTPEITGHLKTVAWLCHEVLGADHDLTPSSDEPAHVVIHGVGRPRSR